MLLVVCKDLMNSASGKPDYDNAFPGVLKGTILGSIHERFNKLMKNTGCEKLLRSFHN